MNPAMNITPMYSGVCAELNENSLDSGPNLPTAPLNTLLGFDLETYQVPLDQLLPCKKVPEGIMSTRKYKQIVSSIKEIGLIEPLSVIQPDPAKAESHGQDARVVLDCDSAGSHIRTGLEHSGELVEIERLATFANTALQEEHFPFTSHPWSPRSPDRDWRRADALPDDRLPFGLSHRFVPFHQWGKLIGWLGQ